MIVKHRVVLWYNHPMFVFWPSNMETKLGKPCKKYGHHRGDGLNVRMAHNGVCLECHRIAGRERAKKPEVRERNNLATKKYREADRKRSSRFAMDYTRRKRATDPYFRLVDRLRARARCALGRGYKKDRTYGIDYHAIARHLGEKPGDDYHVDHIIPLNQFDLTDWDQVLRAFAPENHRWIKASDNLKRPKDGRDETLVQHALPIGIEIGQ